MTKTGKLEYTKDGAIKYLDKDNPAISELEELGWKLKQDKPKAKRKSKKVEDGDDT